MIFLGCFLHASTFWVELPLAEIQELEIPEILEVERKSILYVEDNPANRRLMQSVFDRLPHELQMVENAELGLERALEESFDLILMDIHLHGIDGKELTKRLRETEHYKDKPIIAVSAAAMKHDIELAEGLFNDYVIKPLDIPLLLKMISKNLQKS